MYLLHTLEFASWESREISLLALALPNCDEVANLADAHVLAAFTIHTRRNPKVKRIVAALLECKVRIGKTGQRPSFSARVTAPPL